MGPDRRAARWLVLTGARGEHALLAVKAGGGPLAGQKKCVMGKDGLQSHLGCWRNLAAQRKHRVNASLRARYKQSEWWLSWVTPEAAGRRDGVRRVPHQTRHGQTPLGREAV